jgi:hypothetical protein
MLKIAVLLDVMPFSLVYKYQHFLGILCILVQCGYGITSQKIIMVIFTTVRN